MNYLVYKIIFKPFPLEIHIYILEVVVFRLSH